MLASLKAVTLPARQTARRKPHCQVKAALNGIMRRLQVPGGRCNPIG